MSAAIACRIQCAERTGAPDCTTCTACPFFPRNRTTSWAPAPMRGDSARMAALKTTRWRRQPPVAPDQRAVAACKAHGAAGLGRLLLGDCHSIGLAAEVERAPAIRVRAAAGKREIGRLAM